MRTLILVIALTTLFPPTSSYSEIHLATVLEAGGSTAIATHGNYVFGGLGKFLMSIDASNPVDPVRIGSRELSGNIYDILVSGSLAYVGTDDKLSIFDISNPQAPTLVGTETTSEAIRLALSGSIIFTTRGSEGFRAIDVSNPTHPVGLGATTVSHWPWGIRVVGSYAYTASFTHGDLTVIDVSNPSAPDEIASLNVPASGWDLEIVGQYAYLPHPNGLSIVNIGVPTNPFSVGNYTGSFVNGMCVSIAGDYAYLLGMYGDLEVVDVSDPTHPVGVRYEQFIGGLDVARVGDRLYVADDFSSFQIVDISNPIDPEPVGACRALSGAVSVSIQDDVLFVGEGGRLTTMNVQDAFSPEWLGEFENYYANIALVPSGTTLFVAREATILDGGDGGLSIFDVSQPASPVERSTKYGFNAANGLQVDGTYAYLLGPVTAGQNRLVTYDVTNQLAPVQLSSGSVPFLSRHFEISGNLALVASRTNDLKIYDVSNHTQPPVLVSTFTGTSDATDVVTVGNLAFVADKSAGLVVVDFSNPATPTEIGRLAALGAPERVVDAYPYVVMVGTDPFLRIIDVSDPSTPEVVDSYQAGASYEVAVQGRTIAVVRGSYGPVVLLDAPILSAPTSAHETLPRPTLSAYPNPFNPQTNIVFTIPTQAHVALEVFDAAGRRIRTLLNGSLAARQHRVVWDGRDETGLPCASGVYFVRLDGGSNVMTHKLVLLK